MSLTVPGLDVPSAELCQDGFPGNGRLSSSSGMQRMGTEELGMSRLAGEHHPMPPR